MCGIVGLFLKDKALEPKLGAMLADMLAKLGDRGPDSAGLAIYSGADDGVAKITVQSATPAADFDGITGSAAEAIGAEVVDRGEGHACGSELSDREARRGAGGDQEASIRGCGSWAPATPSRSTRRSATRPKSRSASSLRR